MTQPKERAAEGRPKSLALRRRRLYNLKLEASGKAPEGRILVSVVIIARNEERHIRRCLESVDRLACEIILHDTGSTDRTMEIAAKYGARIFREPFTGSFSHHRNAALDQARGEILVVVDADEEIVNTDLAETRARLEQGGLPPVMMVRLALLYPDGKNITLLAPRLMRADAGIRYVYPVHEQLDVAEVDAAMSNITLLHHGYVDHEQLVAKERRNLDIAMGMPDGAHAYHCRARAALSLGDWEALARSADALVACGDTSPALIIEGCVLGGTAAFNLCRENQFDAFLARGREIAADSPDIRFLEFLGAGRTYLSSLGNGDSVSPGDFIRPWMFWHDRDRVQMVLDTLLGKRFLIAKPARTEDFEVDMEKQFEGGVQ